MKKLSAFFLSILCLLNMAPAQNEECTYLTVAMYHSILNSRQGVYIVSERQLENDLIAYKNAGYNFVFPSEIIAYAEGKSRLPENPLMISFDDGHYNNMFYGLPLMIKHNVKAEINVIGKFCEFSTTSGDDSNPNYSYLTWEQMRILSESGYFEIGCHTYSMHDYKPRYGIDRKYGENDEAYVAAIEADAARLNEKIFAATGKNPDTFAYPFGRYNKDAEKVFAKVGYKLMMTCNEGVTKIKFGDLESIHYVRRYNRSGRYSTAEFIGKLKKGMEKANK